MADIGLGAIGSGVATFAGGIFSTILYVFFYVAIGILLVAVLGFGYYYFIYQKKLYVIDCIILIKRKGRFVMAYDKGGFITKKKSSRFRLKNRKKARVIPPTYENLIMSEGGRSTLYLFKFGEEDYVPLDANLIEDISKFNLTPIEGLSKDALVQDIRELIADLDKPSFWEKWTLPLILIGAVLIIMAGTYFTVALLSKSLNNAANTALISSNNYLIAANITADALRHIGSIGGVG